MKSDPLDALTAPHREPEQRLLPAPTSAEPAFIAVPAWPEYRGMQNERPRMVVNPAHVAMRTAASYYTGNGHELVIQAIRVVRGEARFPDKMGIMTAPSAKDVAEARRWLYEVIGPPPVPEPVNGGLGQGHDYSRLSPEEQETLRRLEAKCRISTGDVEVQR